MTSSASNATALRELVVREPRAEESARVAYLFRNVRLRADARLVVAERAHPVARFVGAATWWVEGDAARFQLACPPGTAQREAAGVLIERVVAAACEGGWASLQYADLLPDEHMWEPVLQAQGFDRLRSERAFRVAYGDAWTRVVRLYEKHRALVPASWRSDPIRAHPPEVILDLIAPHRLLPPEEVRYYWRDTTPGGFDLDMSCILFNAERPFAAFLARRLADVLYIDVQVVAEPNRRLRSLADVCQLHHGAQRVAPGGPIRWIHFRSGENEHRQTANLALRMGGQEVATQHVFARRLRH